jgi:hypothetical protein
MKNFLIFLIKKSETPRFDSLGLLPSNILLCNNKSLSLVIDSSEVVGTYNVSLFSDTP